MSWFRSLILITIILLAYTNATAHLRNSKGKFTTGSFLSSQSHEHPDASDGDAPPKTDEQIEKDLEKEGLIDNEKTIFRNPVVVPKRSTIIMERAKRKKAKFKSMLRKEYLKLAERLTKHKNWTDATYFRRKAYKAGKTDQDILPEDPDQWVIEDDYLLSELYDSRVKLLDGLTASTVFLVPNAAAKSMVYYDCWLEQTQNTWNNDSTDCKQSFSEVYKYLKQARAELRLKSVIDILENYPLVDVEEKFFPYKNMIDNDPYEGDYAKEMKETVKKAFIASEEVEKKEAEEKAAKEAATKAASTDSNAGFIVDQSANDNPEIVFTAYFGEKSDTLNAKGKAEADRAIAEIKKVNPSLIIINGHTDRAVSSGEALLLSKKRADAVRDYIVSKGITKAQVRSYGFGNTDNIVANAEGESVPGNRRAEIMFRAPK